MKAHRKSELGLSLIELMLVFAIASAVIIMSLKQYEVFRSDKDLRQVLYNVDMLAQGAANYYWANCNGQYNPANNTFIPGTLNPVNPTTPPNPYPINITVDLQQKGYLPAQLNLLNNSIVTGAASYVVQFNEAPPTPRTILACDDAACTTSSQKQIGTNINWRIQISVKLRDVTKAQVYRNLFGAECLSNLSGTTVLPCTSAPAGANQYLVFTRPPAFATPRSSSVLNQNQPNLDLFNQQYRVNPITSLTSGDHSVEYQYFLCSGY